METLIIPAKFLLSCFIEVRNSRIMLKNVVQVNAKIKFIHLAQLFIVKIKTTRMHISKLKSHIAIVVDISNWITMFRTKFLPNKYLRNVFIFIFIDCAKTRQGLINVRRVFETFWKFTKEYGRAYMNGLGPDERPKTFASNTDLLSSTAQMNRARGSLFYIVLFCDAVGGNGNFY